MMFSMMMTIHILWWSVCVTKNHHLLSARDERRRREASRPLGLSGRGLALTWWWWWWWQVSFADHAKLRGVRQQKFAESSNFFQDMQWCLSMSVEMMILRIMMMIMMMMPFLHRKIMMRMKMMIMNMIINLQAMMTLPDRQNGDNDVDDIQWWCHIL